jgi:hypothetical protein
MTAYTLNVVFDIHEESEQLVWNIQQTDSSKVVPANTGNRLNGLYGFQGAKQTGGADTLQVQVFATSSNSQMPNLTLNECYLICKPRLAHANALSGVAAGTYPFNSPFPGNHAVNSCLDGMKAALQPARSAPAGINIPATDLTYASTLLPQQPLPLTNAGHWEVSLLISVSYGSDINALKYRVFTLDPEFQVGQGTIPT